MYLQAGDLLAFSKSLDEVYLAGSIVRAHQEIHNGDLVLDDGFLGGLFVFGGEDQRLGSILLDGFGLLGLPDKRKERSVVGETGWLELGEQCATKVARAAGDKDVVRHIRLMKMSFFFFWQSQPT